MCSPQNYWQFIKAVSKLGGNINHQLILSHLILSLRGRFLVSTYLFGIFITVDGGGGVSAQFSTTLKKS